MQNQVNVWVEQSRCGDREAFAQIIRQFQAKVSAVTFSMTGNLQESEDIAQETFLVAWKKLAELSDTEKIGAWLCGIARTLCKNAFRLKQRDPLCVTENGTTTNVELAQIASPIIETETDTVEREELARFAWSAMATIPEQYREPLILFYREGQSVREVAETLELTETCVKQRLHRGRQHLKEEVERFIENALTKTRPSETFVVGILAAIPILATGKQAIAAGSAGAAAAQSSPNTPLFAIIGTQLWKFLFSLVPALLVFVGTILGVWSGIRNAPTLNARRFMIRVTLEYFLLASVLYGVLVFCLLFLQSWRPFFEYTVYSLTVATPIAVFFNSLRVNRMWRKIVETDMVETDEVKPFSRKPLYLLLAAGLSCYTVCCGMRLFDYWRFEHLLYSLPIPIAVILFLWFALRISKNDTAFQKLPPRLPNLLPILTSEQKPPRGLRNRINLIGDLVATGFGLNMTFFYVGWYLRSHYGSSQFILFETFSHIGNNILETLTMMLTGNFYHTLLSIDEYALKTLMMVLTIIACSIFALFFAGIPRKHRWGMIFLGSFVLLIDLFMMLIYIGWYLSSNGGRLHTMEPPETIFITGNGLATSVLVLTIVAYIIFALFFAGIPRKRYWGMIFLGSSVLLIDTLAILVVLTPFLQSTNEWKTVTCVVAWYLVWYILLGVAGLRVFRKHRTL